MPDKIEVPDDLKALLAKAAGSRYSSVIAVLENYANTEPEGDETSAPIDGDAALENYTGDPGGELFEDPDL